MSSTSVPLESPPSPGAPRLPAAPVLLAAAGHAIWIDQEGEVLTLKSAEAAVRARQTAPLVCHARALARRLDCEPFAAFDLLELFAFVRPASFCPPSAHGLAGVLGFAKPRDDEAAAALLPQAALALLRELAARGEADRDAPGIAWVMARAGWPWGPFVIAALGYGEGGQPLPRRNLGLRIWERLPDWEEQAPRGAPGTEPVLPEESRQRRP